MSICLNVCRIPLVLSFFSTEDRIHSLKSEELQNVLNSVLFEPARFLHADVTGMCMNGWMGGWMTCISMRMM
jgi:hypothetical protein